MITKMKRTMIANSILASLGNNRGLMILYESIATFKESEPPDSVPGSAVGNTWTIGFNVDGFWQNHGRGHCHMPRVNPVFDVFNYHA